MNKIPTLNKSEYRELFDLAKQQHARWLGRELFAIFGLILVWLGVLLFSLWLAFSSNLILLSIATVLMAFSILFFSICQHECAHQTLFRSRWANDILGLGCGLIAWMPHFSFRNGHRAHHRFVGSPTRKDPTESKQLKESWWLSSLLKIRLVPFMFLAGVYIPYLIYDFFPTASRRNAFDFIRTLLNLILIGAFHFAVGWATDPSTYAGLLLVSFLLYGILYEHLFTQHQHVGLAPVPNRRVYKYREQANFSRSVKMPLAGWLLYFNLHKEHHMFPQANYRLLPILNRLIASRHRLLAQFTSTDLGVIRRRKHTELFEMSVGDDSQTFDWKCFHRETLTDRKDAKFESFKDLLFQLPLSNDVENDASLYRPCLAGTFQNQEVVLTRLDLCLLALKTADWAEENRFTGSECFILVRPPSGSELSQAALLIALLATDRKVVLLDSNLETLRCAIDRFNPKAILAFEDESHLRSDEKATEFLTKLQQIRAEHQVEQVELPFRLDVDKYLAERSSAENASDLMEFSSALDRGGIDRGGIDRDGLGSERAGVVFASSGTTGERHFVTYRAVDLMTVAQAWDVSNLFELGLGGPTICPSLAHTMGVRNVIHAIWNRATTLLFPSEWLTESPQKALSLIAKFPPKHVTCGPAFLSKIVQLGEFIPELKRVIDGLDVVVSSGAPFVNHLSTLFPDGNLHNAFGMTETQQVLTTLIDRDSVVIEPTSGKQSSELESNDGTETRSPLGYPLAGYGVAVKFEPATRRGEMFVQLPFGDERWIATGDVVEVVGDQLFYVSRLNHDFVNCGLGINLSTIELESKFSRNTGFELLCLQGGLLSGLTGVVFVGGVELDSAVKKKIKQSIAALNHDLIEQSSLSFGKIEKIAFVSGSMPTSSAGKIDLLAVRTQYGEILDALQNDRSHASIVKIPKKPSDKNRA